MISNNENESGLMKRTVIALPDEVHLQIRKLALEYKKSMTKVIEQAVREFLVKHNKEKTEWEKDY